MLYLFVNGKRQPGKQYRTQEISDKYPDKLFISIFGRHVYAGFGPEIQGPARDREGYRIDYPVKIQSSLQKRSKKILGVDPGTLNMGYCVIETNSNSMQMLEMDSMRLSAKKDHYERLQLIHARISELIQLYQPDEFAIEAPFFGKNVQSMLKLGRAQGVAIAAAMQAGIPVTEYSPRKVKQSVTGNGNAGKEQVWKMLRDIFKLKEAPRYFDSSDALAIAVCHHFQMTSPLQKAAGKKLKGWDAFLKNNPERIIVPQPANGRRSS